MVLKRENNKTLIEKKIQTSPLRKKQKLSERFIFSLSKDDKELLEKYFDERGVSLAAGIRLIVNEWMQNNKIK